MTVSVRSCLVASLAAATLSTVAVVPVPTPLADALNLPAIELTAAVLPLIQPAAAITAAVAPAATAAASGSLGNVIINTYDALEPWVAWGFELADWALSFVPGLWWVAPAIDLAYFTAEPIVQSLVYSFAYLIDGQPALIGPTIGAGFTQAADNFVTYAFYWVYSLVPLPPLPPFPVFPVASVAPAGASAIGRVTRAAAAAAAPAAQVGTAIDTGTPAPDAGHVNVPRPVRAAADVARVRHGSDRISRPKSVADVASQSAAVVADAGADVTPVRAESAPSAADQADTRAASPIREPRTASHAAARVARSVGHKG